MPLLQQVMHRLPARGRLLSPSGSPLGRAISRALAHAASGLARFSIACVLSVKQLAAKRQGKKKVPPKGVALKSNAQPPVLRVPRTTRQACEFRTDLPLRIAAARQPPPPYCKINSDGRESRRSFKSGSPAVRVKISETFHPQHPR